MFDRNGDEFSYAPLLFVNLPVVFHQRITVDFNAVTSHGINVGDVKKLQDAGIYTCNGLMMHTKKSLTGIKGLSEAKVDKICEAAEKILDISLEVMFCLRERRLSRSLREVRH